MDEGKAGKLVAARIDPRGFPLRDRYPYDLPLFSGGGELELRLDRGATFLHGENGCGKTSVLKSIARACGIHISEEPDRARYRWNEHEDRLCRHIALEWSGPRPVGHYFSAREFDFFARMLDEWAAADPGQLKYFGGKSLVGQSHGQSLMAFFASRYALEGIYFLDEPETALSPETQIRLLRLLGDYAAAGHAQFVIASHSPILLALPGASIVEVGPGGFGPVAYEDTTSYKVYRDFMADRERFIGNAAPGA